MLLKQKSGFTLLEILLTIAILAIISSIGISFYYNFFKKTQLDAPSNNIISDLKRARANAMSGVDNRKWGIHFVNFTQDYYEIFSSPTDYSNPSKTVDTTVYLTGTIVFTNPIESATKDIVFNKVTGTIASDSSVTISSDDGLTKIINVTTVGNIY